MEGNKSVIRRVPEVINSKKAKKSEKWQQKQLKTVCGVNRTQMSNCATLSCAKKQTNKQKIRTHQKNALIV